MFFHIYLNLPSVFNPVNQTQMQWMDTLMRWVLLEFPVKNIRNLCFVFLPRTAHFILFSYLI